LNTVLLLREFDRLSEAPDAVSRCRQAILDLAVQGRLVRQLPAEDPVDGSLRAISNSADSSSYEALPANWVSSRMSLVTMLITSGSRGWAQYYAKTGAIFVRSQNVKWGALDLRDLARVSLPKAAEGRRTKLERGDLLIVITGDVGHVGAWETDRGEAYISQHIALARPVRTEFTPWLLLWLRAPRAGNRQLRAGIYGGKPGLNLQQVGGISLPLPPLQEQRRIVSKVDELMTMCDELEIAQEQRERRRKQLAAASLARLAAPGDMPGRVAEKDVTFFLSHSSRMVTRAEHVADVRRAILNLAVQGQLANTTTEWHRTTVNDLCEFVTSGSRGWAEYYSSSGASFLRAQNVRFGLLRLDDLAHVTPPNGREGTRTRVMTNDIVVVITGAGVTNPALIDVDLDEAYVSQHLGLLRLRYPAYSRWIMLWLMAEHGARNELIERAYGAGKPGLNLNNLRTLPILVPELPEQERIVAKVRELTAVCDELERSLDAAQAGRTRALEAVLHRVLEEAGAPFA